MENIDTKTKNLNNKNKKIHYLLHNKYCSKLIPYIYSFNTKINL